MQHMGVFGDLARPQRYNAFSSEASEALYPGIFVASGVVLVKRVVCAGAERINGLTGTHISLLT